MKRRSHRPDRVAESLRHLVAAFLQTEARDPRLGFVTVTAVEVSRDLQHATIRVSVMGAEEDRESTMEALQSAKGFVRRRVAQAMSMRHAPELSFVLDRGLDHARRIDALLDELRHDREDP